MESSEFGELHRIQGRARRRQEAGEWIWGPAMLTSIAVRVGAIWAHCWEDAAGEMGLLGPVVLLKAHIFFGPYDVISLED